MIAALIVAAGRGVRMGGDVPKQYRRLDGPPILRRTLEVFRTEPAIGLIQVIIHPDDRPLYEAVAGDLGLPPPVAGGPSRQESVRRGLEALEAAGGVDKVLIHDAVRPLVDRALIGRVITALRTHEAAIAAVPLVDTLKRGEDGRAVGTIPREGLWRAQTPQGFAFASILAAHRRFAGLDLTDDAALAERAGLGVALVMGSEDNFKITTEEDLRRAALLLAGRRALGEG